MYLLSLGIKTNSSVNVCLILTQDNNNVNNTLHTSCLLAAPCNCTLYPAQRYSNGNGITMEGDYELVPTLGHPPSCVTKCLKPIHRLTHLLHVSALCLDCKAVCCWALNKKKMVQGRVKIFWARNMTFCVFRQANVSCTRPGHIVCWKVISLILVSECIV